MGRVQGEGGREKKWERQGGQAGRKDELERQWTPGVNVKWEVEQLVQKRNTLHAAQPLSHITSISIPSPQVPVPSLLAFQPAHLHSLNWALAWACGCQRVPVPWPCLWRLQENIPRKDVARHKTGAWKRDLRN